MTVAILTKNLILSPGKSFLNILDGKYRREILYLFFLSALITFVKSFYSHKNIINFFDSELLNLFFTFLSIPQVIWALSFGSFFLFIYTISIFSRIVRTEKIEFKSLAFIFMSFSTYGILLHIVFALGRFFLPQNIDKYGNLFVFLGFTILSSYALKKTFNLPLVKSVLLFLIPAIPFIFFMDVTGVFPFVMWM